MFFYLFSASFILKKQLLSKKLSPFLSSPLLFSPLLSSWHRCIVGLSDREIQSIIAGWMPTDREAPQHPHSAASDPWPILLPCLVGQTWPLSTPSQSVPRAVAQPTLHRSWHSHSSLSLPAFYSNRRGYNAVFL